MRIVKIKIKIIGGATDEQKFFRDEMNMLLVKMRRRQKHEGKKAVEYKIKAACRGVRSAGWKD